MQRLCAQVDDLAAALAACQAMAHLTDRPSKIEDLKDPEKAAAIVKAGGIEAVLAAGKKHSGSAQVAEQVCRVLQSLACYSNDNKARIAAAGGIEAVVRVLGEHHANAAVIGEACGALANLPAAARIAAAGGIEALVRVLGEHQGNAAVMEQACRALSNIVCSDQKLQKRMKDAGAEPLVRAAVAGPDATDATKEMGQKLLAKMMVCVCVCLYLCMLLMYM